MKIIATYDYRDEEGHLLYQVVRTEPKGFFQRRPLPPEKRRYFGLAPDAEAWVYGLGGGWFGRKQDGSWRAPDDSDQQRTELPAVRVVPYRLPDLVAQPSAPLIVVEGEKDVEALRTLGLLATCNPGGAGKWKAEYGAVLAGRRVCVFPDLDTPGRDHAYQVAGCALAWGCESLRVAGEGYDCMLDSAGKDLSDWLEWKCPGGTSQQRRAAVVALVRAQPEWRCPDRTFGRAAA